MTSTRTARRSDHLLLRAVLALAVSAAVSCGGSSPGEVTEGPVAEDGRIGYPLAGPPPSGFARVEQVGATFTNGQLIVHNRGTEPITLRRVVPEITGDGLRYVGGLVAGPERELAAYQIFAQYPPADQKDLGVLQPAEGAVLEAGAAQDKEGFELLLGFEVTAPGRSTVKSVRLDYEVDGDQETAVFVSTMAICTSGEDRDCPFEMGESD